MLRAVYLQNKVEKKNIIYLNFLFTFSYVFFVFTFLSPTNCLAWVVNSLHAFVNWQQSVAAVASLLASYEQRASWQGNVILRAPSSLVQNSLDCNRLNWVNWEDWGRQASIWSLRLEPNE